MVGLRNLLGLLLLSPSLLSAQELTKTKFPELNEARKSGLFYAAMIVERLDTGDANRFPGIKSWLEDYHKVINSLPLNKSNEDWGPLDLDALVSKNPHFWRMTYEIFPGDPGLMLLHASLLMAGGELTRAGQIASLAIQRPGIPKPFLAGFNSILSHLQKVNEKANAVVFAGIKLYDEGDYGGALKKYQDAIDTWPQNSFAWYEAGLTMMQQERIATGKKPLANDQVALHSDEKLSKEVQHAFQQARIHDPLQQKAYQSDDKEVLAAFSVLNKKAFPAWEKMNQNRNKPSSEESLTELAAAFQEAQLHELALASRQMLIVRRNRFLAEDQPFIAASLRKLIPEDESDTIIKRLSGAKLEFRQIVKPDAEK